MKPNGGPAFPSKIVTPSDCPCGACEPTVTDGPGMSLRDYFAGQALAGLLGRSTMDVPHCEDCRPVGDDPGEHYADIAYRYADAMLAQREKP